MKRNTISFIFLFFILFSGCSLNSNNYQYKENYLEINNNQSLEEAKKKIENELAYYDKILEEKQNNSHQYETGYWVADVG